MKPLHFTYIYIYNQKYSTTLWDLNKMRRRQVTNDCGDFAWKFASIYIHFMINGIHHISKCKYIYLCEYEIWPKLLDKLITDFVCYVSYLPNLKKNINICNYGALSNKINIFPTEVVGR